MESKATDLMLVCNDEFTIEIFKEIENFFNWWNSKRQNSFETALLQKITENRQ